MSRTQSAGVTLVPFVVALLAASPDTAIAQTGYYAGKTVRIVVGSSAGGGYDTYARAIAPFLGEHLPGKPTVVVQNMPGGGGMTSVLHLDAGAPRDGTAVALFNAGIITDVASNPGNAKVNLRNMAWIGSATRSFRACTLWHTSGITTIKGLDRNRQITLGTVGAQSASYHDAMMLKKLVGQNIRTITGYPGRTEIFLAMERGEVDGECGTPEAYPEHWIKDKKANMIVRFSEAPSPEVPAEIPWIGQFLTSKEDLPVLKLLTIANELGRPIVASRQVPSAQVEMLRAAFDAAMRDANYIAVAAKRQLTVSPVSGKEAQDMIGQIVSAPKAVSERAREIIR
jgi:tripartite-type tricarboxylate transporter receptor subunit TctC